jgi:hypothetical protein
MIKIFVCLVVLLCLTACSKTENSTTPPSVSVMPGNVVTMRSPGGTFVPVSASEEVHDRLNKLSAANDTTGIDQLIAAGLVWTIADGTQCKVVNRAGMFTVEVRVMNASGQAEQRTCFVTRDFLK